MPGKIISIYSSKGGTGKTFIAVNLSVDIYRETKKKVLLVDFGLPFSTDVATLLDIKNIKKIEDILPSAGTLSPAIIKSFVTPHVSGIFAVSLTSGEKKLSPEIFNLSNIETVLTKFASSYDYIVVDIGTKYDTVIEKIFDLSSQILVPFIPDYLSVQQAVADLGLLRSRNFSMNMVKPVFNMTKKKDYISEEVVERQIRRKISVSIPYDSESLVRMAETKTYPTDYPRHEVTKAIDGLTLQVVSHARAGKSLAAEEKAEEKQDVVLDELKALIHGKLLESINFKRLDTEVENAPEKLEELKNTVRQRVLEILDSETSIKSRDIRNRVVKEILQEALGLGPLEDLLAERSITEIMVNQWDEIYVEREGRLERIDNKFMSEQHLLKIIGRIVAPIGRRIDASTPMVDGRLKDGSRVNAVIPPLALKGASLTIRKFPEDRVSVEDLIGYGSINKQVAEFLDAAVVAKQNILISGGTGTGKTTLLNILSGFISPDERIVTIEDSAELKLQQPHVITLESRPPNIEGKGEVTIRDLVKNSLRMRPDRIVVGECRGAEALDMLQAMNTGHDGSLTTLHANSPKEALSRLETLVMFAGFELPSAAIKEQIVGAINLIVQIKRFKDGTRKIVQVSETTGIEDSVIAIKDIFMYKQSGIEKGKVTGSFIPTGYVPGCLKQFEERDINISKEIFRGK